MNNCKNIQLNFLVGDYHFDDYCNIFQNQVSNNLLTTDYYYNLDYIKFKRNNTNGTSYGFVLCTYNLDKSFISREYINIDDYSVANSEHTYQLNSNYLYRFSFNRNRYSPSNIVGLQCSSNIGTMSKSLAFGSGNSLFTNLGDLAPLFIVVIGFALGFYFLKNIVRKGQKGKTL